MSLQTIKVLTLSILSIIFINACSLSGKKSVDNENESDSIAEKKTVEDTLAAIPGSTETKVLQSSIDRPKKALPKQRLREEKFESDLPDFAGIKNVVSKKKKFFDFMRPFVMQENRNILDEREFVTAAYQQFHHKNMITDSVQNKLEQMAVKYRSEHTDFSKKSAFKDLLKRVDIIPAELVLTQAAIESAWGTSYFARKVNNIFGQWCFEPGCGVVPRRRRAGDTHEVMTFKNVSASIRSYMLLLNSHPFFKAMRETRVTSRNNNERPSGYAMAQGLSEYSARGNAYVREVRSMIKTNRKYMKLD